MDLRKIKKLIELVEESGISELEVKSGEESVRIARPDPTRISLPTAPVPTIDGQVVPLGVGAAGNAGVTERAARTLQVVAPMAGTFYAAPAPGEAAFVKVGQQIAVGDVLCIVESMKMMNEVRSEVAGICSQVLVDNGEPVETGQRLFLLT